MYHDKPFFWGKKQQDRLIISFLSEAKDQAIRAFYQHGDIELDECTGIAYLALVEAARQYDPLKGKFWPYVEKAIRNAFIDYLKEQ